MCFSAEASFAAGAVLTAAGVYLVHKFHKSNKILLAFIPLFFGIQQLAEGALWEALQHGWYPNAYSRAAQVVFLFFAYMFWPVWIPLAFGWMEKIQWRQIVMGVLMLVGLLFFFNIGYSFIVDGAGEAKIVEHSIDYGTSPLPDRILYCVVTMSPFFLSSISKMWIFGLANTIAFIAADISYNYAFTSVWCGASAIISVGLLLLLNNRTQ